MHFIMNIWPLFLCFPCGVLSVYSGDTHTQCSEHAVVDLLFPYMFMCLFVLYLCVCVCVSECMGELYVCIEFLLCCVTKVINTFLVLHGVTPRPSHDPSISHTFSHPLTLTLEHSFSHNHTCTLSHMHINTHMQLHTSHHQNIVCTNPSMHIHLQKFLSNCLSSFLVLSLALICIHAETASNFGSI